MNSELINKIKTDGIIKLENFLIKKNFPIFKNCKFYSAPKSSKNSYWPTNNKLLLYKILKLDFIKFKFSLKILNFENKKLKNIADNFYGSKSYLRFIDAYYSPVSNKYYRLAYDQAYHGDKKPEKYVNPDHFFLKIFIYLTDVNPLNGCMSYIQDHIKLATQ